MPNLHIEVEEIRPRVIIARYKDYYHLNAAAVIMNNHIVVIDALHFPIQAKKFRERIESEYDLPVKYLFLTHCHSDHVFGMSAFRDVDVIGSIALQENIRQRLMTRWNEQYFNDWKKNEPQIAKEIQEIVIRPPNIVFNGNHVLKDDDLILEFYSSGGHTSCSAYAYFPSEKVLFTGDEIIAHAWPFIFDPTMNPEKYIKALKSMSSLDIDIVIAGHGPIVGLDHVKEYLEHMKKMKEVIISGISNGQTPDSIEAPAFYEPYTDWQIAEAKRSMYSYYSNHH